MHAARLFLPVAILAAACSTTGEPVAATVNGEELTHAFVHELSVIVPLAIEGGVAIDPLDPTPDPAAMASATDFAVQVTLINQELAAQGWTVDPAAIEQLKTEITTALPELGIELDSIAVDRAAQIFASSQTFGTNLSEPEPVEEADIDAFVDANAGLYTEICASQILIEFPDATDPEFTQAEAEALAEAAHARVSGGEDFATVAEEVSDAPSAPAGGDIGCQLNPISAEFSSAALAAGPGGITETVQSSFGFHVVEVHEVTVDEEARDLMRADARTQLEQERATESQAAAGEAFTAMMVEAEVEIDSRIGDWVPVDSNFQELPLDAEADLIFSYIVRAVGGPSVPTTDLLPTTTLLPGIDPSGFLEP